ncbi:MaoC family dehydratase [Psychrobacillus sp. NPDC058041]|uniref:MaoC family dehydratase n=1 Tax=Psychrobacillus sp. NPDC058041 TaxID=3346310 RepID=UPI0036D9B1C8
MNKYVTAEAIQRYAVVSKDSAAIHIDNEAATRAGYKRPIAHGMYIMGLAQSLYLADHPKQWITEYDMKFQKPLLVDTFAIFDFKSSDCNIEVTVTAETGDVIASGSFSVKELEQ